MKRLIIVTFFCAGGVFILYRFLVPRSISVKQIGQPVDTVFVGPQKYENSFAKSLKRAEESAAPFRKAGQLMEAGEYDAALGALDESLQKSTRSIEKSMVYDRMQEIYQRMGNLEKELEAIELWFEEAGEKANSPRLQHRAAEIRSLLAAKNQANQRKPGSGPAGATQPR